jgi:hypothetical protein
VGRLALLLVVAGRAWAADLTGIWVGEIDSGRPDRDPVQISFQFVQKGTALGGKQYGDHQSTPIATGIVAGELVTFVVVTTEQAGNEINDTKVRFTGRLVNGALELMRERESSTRAGAKSGAFVRPGSGQMVRLQRLT